MVVSGMVEDARGRPIAGAALHVYHADSSGRYVREGNPVPRLEARLRCGPHGEYRIRSVVPGGYEGAAHVHFEVSVRGHNAQSFTLNVPPRDPVAARAIPAPPTSVWELRPDAALHRRAGARSLDLAPSAAAVSRRDSAGVVYLHYDVRLR